MNKYNKTNNLLQSVQKTTTPQKTPFKNTFIISLLVVIVFTLFFIWLFAVPHYKSPDNSTFYFWASKSPSLTSPTPSPTPPTPSPTPPTPSPTPQPLPTPQPSPIPSPQVENLQEFPKDDRNSSEPSVPTNLQLNLSNDSINIANTYPQTSPLYTDTVVPADVMVTGPLKTCVDGRYYPELIPTLYPWQIYDNWKNNHKNHHDHDDDDTELGQNINNNISINNTLPTSTQSMPTLTQSLPTSTRSNKFDRKTRAKVYKMNKKNIHQSVKTHKRKMLDELKKQNKTDKTAFRTVYKKSPRKSRIKSRSPRR